MWLLSLLPRGVLRTKKSADPETASEATQSESETTTSGNEPETSSEDEKEDSPDSSTTAAKDSVADQELPESKYMDSYTLNDEEFGTSVAVDVTGTTRTIETNALPDHETGEFPNEGNPNTISAQDITYEFTTEPQFLGEETIARVPGVAVNGVKFEPSTAESVTCDSGETYSVDGLQDTYDLGMDFNNAHVQPTGEYHYHGISEMLVDAYGSDNDLVHVGFAADGFLMYYSKSGAYKSGYSLSTEPRVGTDCVGSGPLGGDSVEIEGTTPDGTFLSDWVHSDETGDLDACNGTEIGGTYVYIVTDNYPFIGRCLNGEVSEDAAGGRSATRRSAASRGWPSRIARASPKYSDEHPPAKHLTGT